MSAPCELHLLGPARVRTPEGRLHQPPARTQAILGQLALTSGPVLRDDLATAQFPDEALADARRHLSQRLFQLRRALPELPLHSDADAITLVPERRWLDIEELRDASRTGDLEARLTALARYRGPLLSGVEGEWVALRRRELEDEYLTLARDTARRLLERHRYHEAVPLLRRVADEHPLAENDVTLLAEVLSDLGRRDEALEVLDTFLALTAEVGIAPRPRTQRLVEQIRRGLPLPSPAVAAAERGRPADVIAAAAWRGDYQRAAERLRSLPPTAWTGEAERHLAQASLALARDQRDEAARHLADCDGQDPRVMILQARLARSVPDGVVAVEKAAAALLATGFEEDDRNRFDALLELAHARGVAAQSRRAIESADAALALARASGHPARVACASMARGVELHRQGRFDEARPLLTDAAALAEQQGLIITHTHALHGLGTLHNVQGDLARAHDLQERELSQWRDLALDRFEAITLTDLASTQLKLGKVAAARSSTQLALRLAEDIGHPVARARARLMLAYAAISEHDEGGAEAMVLTEEGLHLLEEVPQDIWETGALLALRAFLRLNDGDPEGGLHDSDRALETWERRNEPELIPRALAVRGLCLANLGRTKEAVTTTQDAIVTVLERSAEDDHVAIFHYVHGLTLARDGQEEQARRYVEHAWGLLRDLLHVTDPEARPGLLNRDPSTRRLVETVRRWGIADPDTVLAMAPDADQRAPAHASDRKAPPPARPPRLANTPDGVDERRREIGRLLARATADGVARPNIAELARRFDVSQRTVKRDLAALRAASQPPPHGVG